MKIPKVPKAPVYESKTIDRFANGLPRTIFIGSALFYALYLVLFFGLVSINETYINYLHVGIQATISLFLLIRFHPFRNHVLEPQDGPVIFSAAIFLLTSLGLSQYLYYNTKDHLQKYTTYVTSNQPKWAVSPPPPSP
jgi:drug/metabolite transporter (DMT)-like permease